MSGNTYVGKVAAIYDLLYADLSGDTELMVEYLRGTTSGDRVLEFAIGTGRLAFPLAYGGFDVTGIDTSREMLDILAEKDPDGRLDARQGDMIADDPVAGPFDLVLLMCNTMFVAQSLSEQVRIFSNAERSLSDDGIFVLETFNPLHYLSRSHTFFQMRRLSRESTLLEQFSVDPVRQTLHALNTVLEAQGTFSFEQTVRFMFPHEMDAVAHRAGRSLDRRIADWTGSRYDAASPRCISLYRRSIL